jgi:hypothetical protein
MGLDRALKGLPGDRATENAVRDVLQFMTSHVGRRFTAGEVAGNLSRSEHLVEVILSSLATGYILKADGDAYRYERDTAVELEVQRYLRKSGQHSQLAQDNLAKFRGRYGYR